MAPAVSLFGDQAVRAHQRQMLGDTGARQVERRSQRRHVTLPKMKLFQNANPVRMSDDFAQFSKFAGDAGAKGHGALFPYMQILITARI